jgi:DNA mismatch endonuclease (patch repair protein)
MAKIKGSGNRTTELRLVQILRRSRIIGWRRRSNVFGKPDFAFLKAKLVIFVDGCFWHGCPRCYTSPATNSAFWRAKVQRNRQRDLTVNRELRKRKWVVMRLWECQLKDDAKVTRRIQNKLDRLGPAATAKAH